MNGFLGLSYPLPDGFYDNTGESLASHAGESPNGIFYLLVADRSAGGANRNRILLVADDASHYATGFTVKDYVVRMAQALGTHGVGSGADPSAVQFGGQDFFRADFHQDVKGGVQYKAFMATLAHGYFLSWTFVAMAQPQLDELVNSLQKVAFTAGETARPNSDAANPGATAPATTGQVPTSGPPMRVRVSEKVFQALLVKKVNPIYPATARDARIQGSVLLRVVVSRDGDVTEVTLISGHPMLVDSAIQAVKQWKFKPYLLNGEPVEVETQTMVNYELHRY